jgi:hypothetical protein
VPPVEAVEGLRTKALDGAALLAGQKASLFWLAFSSRKTKRHALALSYNYLAVEFSRVFFQEESAIMEHARETNNLFFDKFEKESNF